MKPPYVPNPWKLYSFSIFLIAVILLGFVSATISSPTKPNEGTNTVELMQNISIFADLWRSNKIEKAIILHVPTDWVFALEFSPKRLNTDATFCLIVQQPKQLDLVSQLVKKISRTTPHELDKQSPIRWGFIFLTSDGEQAFSLYIDKSGLKGCINGVQVEYESDDLFKWAESTIGADWK